MANARSRTENSAKNVSVALVAKIVSIVMGYGVRIVFTHTLSQNYVGVNGLFTDIIQILSLSELGIGTAITYALYRPIQEGDVEKQKSIMRLFRNLYRMVAGSILCIGLGILPFIGRFVSAEGEIPHLQLIFLLYLVNSASSYLMIYKSILIDAHQQVYLSTLYRTIAWMVQDVVQVIILVTTGNFILYLVSNLSAILISNALLARRAQSMFPYLREKEVQPLAAFEKKGIYKNIQAMILHRMGGVMVNNTDNLILSAFVGIISVGKYSNYYLVIYSVKEVFEQIVIGIAASVGNLGVSSDRGHVKKVFDTVFFLCQWMYGFAAIALFEIINPFIHMSFGANYLFEKPVVAILCLNFFVLGMRQAVLVFRDSLGLFRADRYKGIAEAVLNLVISLLLVGRWGVMGVFLGTFVSTLLVSFWIEPYVLHDYLQARLAPFFVKYLFYISVTLVVFLVTDSMCARYEGGLLMTLVYRFAVCLVVPNLFYLVVYGRTEAFRELFRIGRNVLNQYRRRDR